MRILAGPRADHRSRFHGTRTVASRCGFEAKDISRRDAATEAPIFILSWCVPGFLRPLLARRSRAPRSSARFSRARSDTLDTRAPPRRTTAPPFAMPLDDTTAERFDPMMLQMAQQVAAMADGENPINLMLDLYFGFLRRKTDFFSAPDQCKEGGPLRLRAPGGDRPPGQRVEGSVRGEARG